MGAGRLVQLIRALTLRRRSPGAAGPERLLAQGIGRQFVDRNAQDPASVYEARGARQAAMMLNGALVQETRALWTNRKSPQRAFWDGSNIAYM